MKWEVVNLENTYNIIKKTKSQNTQTEPKLTKETNTQTETQTETEIDNNKHSESENTPLHVGEKSDGYVDENLELAKLLTYFNVKPRFNFIDNLKKTIRIPYILYMEDTIRITY